MKTGNKFKGITDREYDGRILMGDFSFDLKKRVSDCISGFRLFEKTGSPALPYLSAWHEAGDTIWYEFFSRRLTDLLGCEPGGVADFMRTSIIDQRVYKYLEDQTRVTQEIIGRRELDQAKESMREAVKQRGEVEAVYKMALGENRTIWLKDQAVIETHVRDGVCLSPGCLTVVTKEMEAEEELKTTRDELKKYRDHLEDLVNERNMELLKTNRKLTEEIHERKQAESSLRVQSQHLEEVNTALKVLLKQRENDKKVLEEAVTSNVSELINPYLEKLKESRLKEEQRTLLGILDSNLNNIVSPFIRKISSKILNFTPMEIKVANLVKEGKTNQEIADLLFLSKNTILVHRHHIRTKLGIKNKKANLRSYLLSLEK